VFSREQSLQIQTIFGVAVITLAWYLEVGHIEFIVLLILAFSVVIVEGVNTVLERVVDLAEPRYRDMVRDIKDAMAGFVFLTAFAASVIGVFILWPYLMQAFSW